MLTLQAINKSFTTRNGISHILKDVNLRIEQGEIISFVGTNGCGKSTLFRIIAGLIPADEGCVSFDSKHTAPKPSVSMFPQQYRESLLPWRTVRENLHLPFEPDNSASIIPSEVEKYIDDMLVVFDIQELEHTRPRTLSGGQAQLVTLARALVSPTPKLILLDEPFSALDGRNLNRAVEMIVKVTEERKATTIIITHDIDVGILIANRIAIMWNGESSVKEIIESPTNNKLDLSQLTTSAFMECKRRVLEVMIPNQQ